MNKEGERKSESLSVKFLFGSVGLLRALSQFERRLMFYRRFYNRKDATEIPLDFLQGFKFSVIAILHRIIIDCVSSPELVGVRRSERILHAYSHGKFETGSLRKLPDRSSQGILIGNLLAARKAILKARSWDALRSEFARLMEFMQWFEVIFSSCYTAFSEGNVKQTRDPNTVLATKLPSVLLVYLNDAKNLTRAFIEMYRSIKSKGSRVDLRRFTRILGEDPFEREIGLDIMVKDRSVLEGFKFSNLFLWFSVLGGDLFLEKQSLFQRLRETIDWKKFDEFFGVLRDDIVLPLEEENKVEFFHLFKTKTVGTALSKRLVVPLTKPKRRQSTLGDIFHHLPARVVSFEGSNGAMHFTTTLLGLVHAYIIGFMKSKVEAVEIIHKGRRGNNYSYALFMPCSSLTAGYSRWWVFYNCATDYSGAGGFNFKMIHHFIDQYRKQISLRRRIISEDNLFDYLKSDYVRYIEEESRKATDINALMRGALLELLVALYFSKRGFDVRVRHKSPALRREYDIIAVKKESNDVTSVRLVECKEKSITVDSEEFKRLADKYLENLRKATKSKGPFGVTHDDIILEELQSFQNRIKDVRKNIHKLMKELNIEKSENIDFKGILATTELYKASAETTSDIELWTWWVLREKLVSVGIDKSFLEIVEKHLRAEVGRPIIDLFFYKDYFD